MIKSLVRKAAFMGHLITTDGLKLNPTIVEAILNMPTPMDRPGVCRFLGVIDCLSKFCPKPSSDLTKDDTTFVWSEQNQLTKAEVLPTSAPFLAYYNVNAPVVLQVDTSSYGLGKALLQPTKLLPDNNFDETSLQPLVYTSKSFTPLRKSTPKLKKNVLLSSRRLTNLTDGCSGNQMLQFTQTTNHVNPFSKSTLQPRPSACRKWWSHNATPLRSFTSGARPYIWGAHCQDRNAS